MGNPASVAKSKDCSPLPPRCILTCILTYSDMDMHTDMHVHMGMHTHTQMFIHRGGHTTIHRFLGVRVSLASALPLAFC